MAARLKKLRELRRKVKSLGAPKRQSLTPSQRKDILGKTGDRCHICGGKIKRGEKWQADHVLAHAHGGKHSANNYLPAHALCNNYRWFYGVEEFQWILKLGVWAGTQIEKQDSLGLNLADQFVKYERIRISRQKRVVPIKREVAKSFNESAHIKRAI